MGSGYLTNKKNAGTCRELKGTIRFYTVFVNSPANVWSEQEKAAFEAESRKVLDRLTLEAEKDGVFLRFVAAAEELEVTQEITYSNRDSVCTALLEKYGFSSLREFYSVISGIICSNDSAQTVLLFAMKNEGRDFASSSSGDDVEFLFVYGARCDALMHETLHLFGAKDYYYPERIAQTARRLFPNSVMLSSKLSEIDSLTRYLIGWTNTLTDAAREMLQVGFSYTEEQINEELNRQWKADYTVVTYQNSTYYGPIKDGRRNGKGKLEYRDGSVYEGDFADDKRHGKGKLKYRDGAVYEGDFVGDKRSGKGKLVFSNGAVYEGDFVNGKRQGKGKLTYANGAVYEGDFAGDKCEGKGKLTYASGTVYEGEFANDSPNGRGRWIYPDGNVREGTFADGKLVQ